MDSSGGFRFSSLGRMGLERTVTLIFSVWLDGVGVVESRCAVESLVEGRGVVKSLVEGRGVVKLLVDGRGVVKLLVDGRGVVELSWLLEFKLLFALKRIYIFY